MRPRKLELRNFMSYKEAEIDFREIDIASIVGPNGAGKCLPGNVRLFDPTTGEMVKISQFVSERRKKTLGLVDGKIKEIGVTGWHSLDRKQIARIYLKNGVEFDAATTHPVLTDRGCVRVSDLKTSDYIAQARRVPGNKKLVSEDEARLLGLLLGDGTLRGTTIGFTNKDECVIDLFADLVAKVFPNTAVNKSNWPNNLTVRPSSSFDKRQRRDAILRFVAECERVGVDLETYTNNASMVRRGIHCVTYESFEKIETDFGLDLWRLKCGLYSARVIVEWLKNFGIYGKGARQKHIPQQLFSLPEKEALALIGGLWQSDGWFEQEKGIASILTASKQLAMDTRFVLLRLGVQTSIRCPQGFWRVTVTPQSLLNTFCRVPLIGEKASQRDEVISVVSSRHRNPNWDVIPPSFCKKLNPGTSQSGKRYRTKKQLYKHGMSREIYLDFDGDQEVVDMDVTWVKLDKIEQLGKKKTYDISVNTEEHLYVAETTIVHNSTILQAITYALWGQVRTASHNDVVRRGTGFCAVRLDFGIGDREYIVLRRRHLSGSGSSDLELSEYSPGSGTAIPMTKATIRETQAEINKLLGMSYDAFSSSTLLQQGDASTFSDARPGERKELLAEMLDLRWFQILEGLAREKLKGIAAEILSATALLEDKEASLQGMDVTAEQIDFAIEQATDARNAIQDKINTDSAVLNVTRQDLESAKGLKGELDGKLELLASYVDRKQEILEQIDALSARCSDLERILCREEEIADAKGEMDLTREIVERLSELAIEAGKLQATAAGLSSYQQALIEHLKGIDNLRGVTGKLEDEYDELAKSKEEIDAGYVENHELAVRATQAVLTARARIDGVQERLQLLQGPEPICPTCHSELEDKETLLAEIKNELATEKAKLADLQSIEKMALADNRDTEEMSRELAAKLSIKEAEIQTNTSDLKVLVARADSMRQQVEEKEAAQEALDALDFDQEYYRFLKAEIAERGQTVDDEYAELVAAKKEHGKIGDDLNDASERLNKGVQMIGDVEKEIATLEDMITTLPEILWLENQIGIKSVSLIALRDNLREQDREITRLEGIRDRANTLVEEIVDLESKIGLLQWNRQVCDLLVKASSKTGAQALIIEAAIPQIEKDANELLKVMASNMEMALRSQRQTQKGTAVETLDIVIYSDGQVAPIETLSGGERFRADLALRLAIGRMVGRRSPTAIEMLAIDEGFGSQDNDGQEAVIEVVSSLQALFGLILVISHVQAVAKAIGVTGNTIVVSKIGNESRLEVV